jgi:hypothetical protein
MQTKAIAGTNWIGVFESKATCLRAEVACVLDSGQSAWDHPSVTLKACASPKS